MLFFCIFYNFIFCCPFASLNASPRMRIPTCTLWTTTVRKKYSLQNEVWDHLQLVRPDSKMNALAQRQAINPKTGGSYRNNGVQTHREREHFCFFTPKINNDFHNVSIIFNFFFLLNFCLSKDKYALSKEKSIVIIILQRTFNGKGFSLKFIYSR